MTYPIHDTPHALITGASRGLGRAVAQTLAERGWALVLDARHPDLLEDVGAELRRITDVAVVAGDVADSAHRMALAALVKRRGGRLDLLMNNASSLGPTPLPALLRSPHGALAATLAVNTIAPLELTRLTAAALRATGGAVINVSSDAAVEAYAGWGVYGASKAALDQLTRVFAVEEPELSFYAFDPGDMRTDMHRAAFPTEDISDRPLPHTVVPALLRLVDERPPSGRYTKSQLEEMVVS